jgi:hypothetical protein
MNRLGSTLVQFHRANGIGSIEALAFGFYSVGSAVCSGDEEAAVD